MLKHIGRRVAPPRFVLFCLLFPAASVAAAGPLGPGRGALAGFSVAAFVFLVSISPLLRQGEADKIRTAAKRNDANRAVLLGITFCTMLVVLTAVAREVGSKQDIASTILVIVTLVLAWLFSNTIYALHYAHLYYGDDNGQSGDDKGLEFPHCDEPDYWDFIYFSFTLGMTFQTSDVTIASRRMRRIVIGQCLAAFVFNLGVLAFSINVLGSGGGGG